MLKAFPLLPAAAMTFALIQGQEFKEELVAVNFPTQVNANMGHGMAYMVLSRVCKSDQLFVANFHRDFVEPHPEAKM